MEKTLDRKIWPQIIQEAVLGYLNSIEIAVEPAEIAPVVIKNS